MHYEIPVVAVDFDGQRVLINEGDFDAAIHSLWVEAEQEEKDSAQQETPAAAKPRGRRASN
jgi:hypothetical protein